MAPAYAEPVEQAAVEAAITLQLLSFTEWPAEENADASQPRRIGVFGSAEYLSAFRTIIGDARYQGRFTVGAADADQTPEQLAQFDAIFFPQPDDTAVPRIVRKLEGQPVLLVGAFDGFLEQGGMVNLIKNQRKLSFEIHRTNSSRHGIEYRAKLLRLASKVIQE